MILVYYRRKDGTIRHFHEYRGNKSFFEVQVDAASYSQSMDGKETAHVVEYENDSIEAHLFQTCQQRKAWDKEKSVGFDRFAEDGARCRL